MLSLGEDKVRNLDFFLERHYSPCTERKRPHLRKSQRSFPKKKEWRLCGVMDVPQTSVFVESSLTRTAGIGRSHFVNWL